MYLGRRLLAIIPARGGSKGIPRKNIKVLGDKPLIAWTIEAALNSKYIDRVIVSTDDMEIACAAEQFGSDVPFIRPRDLASDTADSVSVVLHTLNTLEETYDYFLLLQPTSPFRASTHIDDAIEFLMHENVHSLVSVVESNENPFWMYWVNDSNNMENVLAGGEKFMRRQDLPKAYMVNGAIYIWNVNAFISEKSFIKRDTLAFIMSKESSIDIDTPSDFILAESHFS